jgi:alcohol dehydrogenase (cytochrome c)
MPQSHTAHVRRALRPRSTWVTGTYDPEFDLVYWGVGNPAPWNPILRKGDNLYTNLVLALRPKTGEVVWSYQMSPNDPFDYDGVNEWIIADLKDSSGNMRKVVMQANRNGFLYVIDRTTGKLVAANKFVDVNWADRVDLATGRPVWSEDTKTIIEHGGKARIFPSVTGGKNWAPMAFDPTRGLVYVNAIEIGMDYETLPADKIANLKPGDPYFGVKFPLVFDPEKRGSLKAIDPLTGEVKWQVPFKTSNFAGTLVTAGGLVITGQMTGEVMALDADTGKLLWQFQTPSAINGAPIDGKQYITVNSSIGGVYAMHVEDARLEHVPAGGTVWTFKLFEEFPQRSASSH